jgi:predicted PurR-regulated permease PerM
VTTERRTLFWIGLGLGLFALLWLLRSILLPFVVGMAIGYFLDPIVARLERLGMPRAAAAGALIAGSFALGALALVLVVPVVVDQATALAERLPDLLAWARDAVLPLVTSVGARFGMGTVPALGEPSAELVQRATSLVTGLAARLLSGGLAIVNVVALLAITPLVAFYLLRDWPKVMAEIDSWLPRQYAETIREQARRIDAVLAGFARGSAVVCLVLGSFYAIALTVAGLDFGLVIGLVAGAVSFVPYLGATFGLGSSVGVALYQFWPDWIRVAIVAAIFFTGQILQDYVLVPRLVGDQVGLHPLWVMFGVLAGGVLFGFAGVLLALPVCAVIGVLVRFAIGRYRESAVYLGDH